MKGSLVIMEEINESDRMRSIKKVSMEEANGFLNMKKKQAKTIANAVFMCIISPVILILLAGLAENGVFSLTENVAAGIGLVFLLGMIAAAVYMFIISGIQGKSMEYVESEDIEIGDSIHEMVKQKNELYTSVFAKGLASGVVLCIFAVIPLIIAALMETPDYICCAFTSLLLLIVAVGVNMILKVSIVKASYDALLQEGEFSKEEKKAKRKMETLSGIYWCIITAIYLGWSFFTKQWDITWIVWPVAGLLYAAIHGVAKLVIGES